VVALVLLALSAGGYYFFGRRGAAAAHREREVAPQPVVMQPVVPPTQTTAEDPAKPADTPKPSQKPAAEPPGQVTSQLREARAFIARGRTELDNGNYAAAIASFREALRVDPGNPAAEAGLKRAQQARRAEAEVLGRRR
jgi:cytochrome c-type biogenesis protein CcmH/NrfG